MIRALPIAISLSVLLASSAHAGKTTRQSVDSAGTPSNGGFSGAPSIAANGRFVAFESQATNLVPGDTNATSDVFVRDRKKGKTTRISVASNGTQAAGGESFVAAMSASGRFVAFESGATNLVPGDTNGLFDVFVHDRTTKRTTRVSVGSGGTQALGGDTNNATISANGRFIAFESDATNLVSGDSNGKRDVFLHDRKTGATTRISVDSAGAQGDGNSTDPSISANGRFVAFASDASNLVAGDTNGKVDVFVHDRQLGTTVRASVDSAGVQSTGGTSNRPAISANGRFVAFDSSATNLVSGDSNLDRDIFVHDLKTGSTTRVSVDSSGVQGEGDSLFAAISAKGRFVGFESAVTTLVNSDTNGGRDIFVHDRKTGVTTRASVDSSGGQPSGESFAASMSANGRFVAFESEAPNLIAGDSNASSDVFVHDRK